MEPAPDSALQAELLAYARLKPSLVRLWRDVFSREDEPYTAVVVPSVSLEHRELERHADALCWEETLLFLLIRLRNPRARVVYVTSRPLPPLVLDYYLHFLAGIPASHARERVTLLSAHDASARPLTEKLLERPRLLQRIRAAIPDPSRAYLTVLRSTPLERRLAVALGLPLDAADPGQEALVGKSQARRLLRASGIAVADGCEDLRDERDLVAALGELAQRQPGLRWAVIKRDGGHWDEGHARVELPADPTPERLRAALDSLALSSPLETPASFRQRFAEHGGIAEAWIEGHDFTVASAQMRIDPLGGVQVTSTHEELRGGPTGMAAHGCRFPASEEHRSPLAAAGATIARRLAALGVVSRVSAEFLLWRDTPDGAWRMAGTEINLGAGGTTHPLLAVRFLCGGGLDPETGIQYSQSGRPRYYRACDNLGRPAWRGLTPEDLLEILTLRRLHYSPHGESGALCYGLGALSEFGRVGLVAVGGSRDEAEQAFASTVAAVDAAAGS